MIITNINVLELGKIILPAFAILISVILLVKSNRNTRELAVWQAEANY